MYTEFYLCERIYVGSYRRTCYFSFIESDSGIITKANSWDLLKRIS